MIDSRYNVIKDLLEAGAIKKFTDIFIWIPYTIVADDFKIGHNKMKNLKSDPSLWKLSEINKLADLIKCNCEALSKMANKEAQEKENPDA